MKNYESIEVEIDDSNHLAIIYLNRPQQLNAFTIKYVDELISAFKEISNDDKIRCLILSGRGKAFCAGGDVSEFQKAEKPAEFMNDLASRLHQGIEILKNMKILTIAAINGVCFGAGLGYATACDFRISVRNATFGCAFTRIGLSPDSSSTFHLPKLVGLSIANEMLFLNRVLNAEEALQYNLVNKVVNSEVFMEETKNLAIEISRGAPIAFAFTKKLLKESYKNDLETHLDREAEHIVKTAGTEDFQEGLKAFFEKRKPDFTGR
ncbi:MAG: enoyl-CoA hydratase/isomerase family protein [Candidatus Lokiarchaeota archaeon]|nr:enoyl-CoA hydratase/isomerase family protein [Candidatus Lokiarchaeota archaeon]